MKTTNGSIVLLVLSAVAACGGGNAGESPGGKDGGTGVGPNGGGGGPDGGVAGGDGGGGGANCSVTYDPNGATGGSVPVDSNCYSIGATVTVLGNTGNIVESPFLFAGWQTEADGSGSTYLPGQTFGMPAAGTTTLYALWSAARAYVPDALANTVSEYTIGPNGQLSPMGTPGVAVQSDPTALDVDPLGRYAYVSNVDSYTLSQFTIGAYGVLTPMNPATVAVPAGASAQVMVHPSGQYVYVTDGNAKIILQYAVGANGTLTPMTPPSVADEQPAFGIVSDPSGKYAYVTNCCGGSTISQYTIDPTTGQLAAMSSPTVPSGSNLQGIAMHPSGTYVYAVSADDATVSQYAVGSDGSLSAIGTPVATGMEPLGIAVDPSGKYAYVANAGVAAVSQYTIDATTGLLTPMSPPTVATDPTGGGGTDGISVDPSGKFAYASNGNGGTISQFSIGSNGALTTLSHPVVQTGANPYRLVFAKNPASN